MIGVYAGTFDPITFGHLDIIIRASKIVDKLVIAVANNYRKQYLFSVEDRIRHIKALTTDIPNIEVAYYDDLTVNFVKNIGADVMIRGLRGNKDFDFEFNLSIANKNLDDTIETVFLVTDTKFLHISSSLVKEIGGYGGNIENMVDKRILNEVLEALKNR